MRFDQTPPVSPALLHHLSERNLRRENRVADQITLEAIFLSTFVMISQNRADEKRQVIADQQWQTVQQEELQNERLLVQSTELLLLTRQIHARSDPAQSRPLPTEGRT